MRLAVGLVLWLQSAIAFAATLAPTLANGALGVRIDALPLPATLSRELESGLTNRLYVRVSLLDGQALVQARTVEITIRYDLWEETFTVTRTMEGAAADRQQLASSTEVNASLATLRLPRLFAARSLPADRELSLRAEVLLNPIGREKLRMIRKWVAENSTPDVGADQGISTSNTIFNRIFEQYADGSDVAAEWRADVASPPFRPGALIDEGR